MLNTAQWLVDNGRTTWSIRTLREVTSVGWAVYRYPVLGQVQLHWVFAKAVIPVIAQLFDKKVKANECGYGTAVKFRFPIPTNIA